MTSCTKNAKLLLWKLKSKIIMGIQFFTFNSDIHLFNRMTKEFSTVNNSIQIKKLLRVLSQEFAISQNPHTRKGGLIGLAAMAIALGKVFITTQYVQLYMSF